MIRALSLSFVAAVVTVAGTAAAHPGHATPHLLHEADAILGWWVVGVTGVVAAAAALLARRRR